MGFGTQTFRLQVLSGGDPLREERLTRSLRDALADLEGVTVRLASGHGQTADGSKGGVVADLSLWAAVAYSAKPASQLLATAVKEWCAKERHRKVRIVRGDRSIEIQGHPDEAQERLVHEFLAADRDGE